jgi:hypothetical protein
MNRKIATLTAAVFSLSLFMTACKKDKVKPDDSNEEELITTVKLKITESGTTTTNTYSWKDLDGEGGNLPVIQGITLSPNKSYEVEVDFLDESKNPAEDITEEILEEADDHEVFYQLSNALVTITRTDKDTKNLPLGLKADVVTSGSGSANLTIILKHKPGTKAAGDNAAKGETDIEVSFPLTVN